MNYGDNMLHFDGRERKKGNTCYKMHIVNKTEQFRSLKFLIKKTVVCSVSSVVHEIQSIHRTLHCMVRSCCHSSGIRIWPFTLCLIVKKVPENFNRGPQTTCTRRQHSVLADSSPQCQTRRSARQMMPPPRRRPKRRERPTWRMNLWTRSSGSTLSSNAWIISFWLIISPKG